MAPEVVLGRGYNQTVDVYSFGILIWQMVTGKVPFREMGKKTFFDKVVIGGQRLKLEPYWPIAFQTLLKKCWHEDKLQRPTFKQVCYELETLIKMEEEVVRMKQNRFDRQCLDRCGLCSPWLRLIVVIGSGLVMMACIASVIGEDNGSGSSGGKDTVAAAVFGAISAFTCYVFVMQILRGKSISSPTLAAPLTTLTSTDFESPTSGITTSVMMESKRKSERDRDRDRERDRERERTPSRGSSSKKKSHSSSGQGVIDIETAMDLENEMESEFAGGAEVAFNPLNKVKQRNFSSNV
jgi:hypothetical protein